MKKYLLWLTIIVLISGLFLLMVELNPPGIEKGWTIRRCLEGIYTLPPATQTVVASYTPLPICATEAAATAEASIPAWWPFGH